MQLKYNLLSRVPIKKRFVTVLESKQEELDRTRGSYVNV
jgi:hypothetical protein